MSDILFWYITSNLNCDRVKCSPLHPHLYILIGINRLILTNLMRKFIFLLTKKSRGITIAQSLIVLLEHFRGVFRTLSNIPVKVGAFCDTSERPKAINLFRKTLLHLSYLTGLWKSLCMELFDCYTPFSKIVIELFDAAISNSFHVKQNKAAP